MGEDTVAKTEEDKYREKARKLIAALQPASQVAHLLMEDGAPKDMATTLAYSAKILAYSERSRIALGATLSSGFVTVFLAVLNPTFIPYVAIYVGVPFGLSLLTWLDTRKQIRLARQHLATL